MPTVYPIQWQPAAATGRYEQIQRRDLAILERFLLKHGPELDAVAYGVAVGGVQPQLEDLTDEQRLGWQYTTALKIDVIVREHGQLWACEVKPIASTSAIGAAIVYPMLMARELPGEPIAGGGIICGSVPADIEWLTQQLRIRTWVV